MKATPTQNLKRCACLLELDACITEAEVSTLAQAQTIRVLARTGFDTSVTLQTLWDEMDTLSVLREVRRSLGPAP